MVRLIPPDPVGLTTDQIAMIKILEDARADIISGRCRAIVLAAALDVENRVDLAFAFARRDEISQIETIGVASALLAAVNRTAEHTCGKND